MTPLPTALARLPDGSLRIDWNDGAARIYSVGELREACPCASCNEKRMMEEIAPPDPLALPVIAGPAEPLAIAGMKPVGNYAYSIAFSDGHDTGIYPLVLLRELGREVE